MEERRWVCLVARIRGRRQQRIWFIMASLPVSLSPLLSSFLSSLSLFHWLSLSSTLNSILSISTGLLTGSVWLIWVLTAAISKGYYFYGCSWFSFHHEHAEINPKQLQFIWHSQQISFRSISFQSHGSNIHSVILLPHQHLCVYVLVCVFTWSCTSCTHMNGQYWFIETWTTSGCENVQGQSQGEEKESGTHVRIGDKRGNGEPFIRWKDDVQLFSHPLLNYLKQVYQSRS